MALLLLAFPFVLFFVVRYYSGVHLGLIDAFVAFIQISLILLPQYMTVCEINTGRLCLEISYVPRLETIGKKNN